MKLRIQHSGLSASSYVMELELGSPTPTGVDLSVGEVKGTESGPAMPACYRNAPEDVDPPLVIENGFGQDELANGFGEDLYDEEEEEQEDENRVEVEDIVWMAAIGLVVGYFLIYGIFLFFRYMMD